MLPNCLAFQKTCVADFLPNFRRVSTMTGMICRIFYTISEMPLFTWLSLTKLSGGITSSSFCNYMQKGSIARIQQWILLWCTPTKRFLLGWPIFARPTRVTSICTISTDQVLAQTLALFAPSAIVNCFDAFEVDTHGYIVLLLWRRGGSRVWGKG